MGARKHWVPSAVIALGLAWVFSTPLQGEERPTAAPSAASPESRDLPDLSKLHPFHRALYLSSRRGAEWLWQANRPDGLFVYGHHPAVNLPMEGDNYLHQIGGALALAQAARYTGQARYTARARQAVLALLASTKTDPNDPKVRYSGFPSSHANRLAASGLLLLAIHELPEPGEDLLQQSEELCNFIRKQQQADGSFNTADDLPDGKTEADQEGVLLYPAMALAGLMHSQPLDWKAETARKALAYYRPAWQKDKNAAAVPWFSHAFTEAYLKTKDKAFADCVFEMNDWLCDLQMGVNTKNPLWQGGFPVWKDDKVQGGPPEVGSGIYADGLADACRAARQTGDAQRFNRYRAATEACLQFLTTLQYTAANTTHFSEDYRGRLLGAYHASPLDGDIRIDYTQHAVGALLHYLEAVAEVPGK